MQKIETKQKILTKALELFSERGYDAVSVDEIAKAVGIKAPSLYNHFPSKKAIFLAIVESIQSQYDEDTDQIDIHVGDAKKDIPQFEETSFETLFEKVRQMFLYSLHNQTISRFRRMMTIEQFRSQELGSLYSKQYVDCLLRYHADIFRSLIKNDEIANEDPEALALMYVAPIALLIVVCDRNPEKEQECLKKLHSHVELFFRMVHRKK